MSKWDRHFSETHISEKIAQGVHHRKRQNSHKLTSMNRKEIGITSGYQLQPITLPIKNFLNYNYYLSTADSWSFIEIESPHEKHKEWSYSKLHQSNSCRIVEHLQNLKKKSVVKYQALYHTELF